MAFKDISSVCDIERESFPDPWTRRMFEEELSNREAQYVVCRNRGGPATSALAGKHARHFGVGGQVIAYAGFRVCPPGAEIMNLAVCRDYRRKGIASMLLAHIFKILKNLNIREVFLEVRSNNEPALELYRRYGFCFNRLRRGYYRSGQPDAIEMKLFL